MSQLPQASLARSSLIKMGVRIAIVIVLTTVISYLHIFRLMRDSTLSQLAQHVAERGQREQNVFLLAQDNHAVLNKALEERIRAWRQQDPTPRFDSLFVRLPDGTIRNRTEGFDGTRMAGAFTPRGAKDEVDFRRRLLASYEVVSQYGPAFHTRFMDTYVLLPEGSDVVYWPGDPNWALNAEPTFLVTGFEYFIQTLPENNPGRQTMWTGIFEDAPSRKWMVSVTTPLDVDGRHVATAALSAARYVLVFGLVSLLLELVIVFWVLRELERRIETRTREQGHGFGLHSSALAARELGGTLEVHSDGPGQGASFVLELPLHSTEGAS